MEVQYDLFNLKEKNVPELWDILRMNTYKAYYTKSLYEPKQEKTIEKRFVDMFYRVFSMLNSYIYWLCKRKASMVFSPNSRYYNDGVLYDKISKNLIIDAGNKAFVVEDHIFCKHYLYNAFYPYLYSRLVARIYKNACISKTNIAKINYALIDAFGENLIGENGLNEIYRQFLIQRDIFRFIFKHHKTEKFFYILNGSFKGAITAAKEYNITCYELQHGAFENDHPAYSYPVIAHSNSTQIIMPDCLLTFGKYWGTNVNFPVNKIKVIGNDEYVNNPKQIDIRNHIITISNSLHKNILMPIVMDYAEKHQNQLIIYKLHPGEFRYKKEYENELKKYSNIKVFSTEYDIRDLLSSSTLVLLAATTVMSTCLYESLNYKKKVLVIKPMVDEGPEFLYHCPNVFVSEGKNPESDIKRAMLAEVKDISECTYFESYKGLQSVLYE